MMLYHGSRLGFASHLTMTVLRNRHPEVPAKRASRLGFASHLTMTILRNRHPVVPAKRATKETI
jgi:hypothetical protein